MAENLGTAVLRLEVDDTALREGLAQARRLIEGTSVELGRQTRSAGRAQRASAPGARLGGAREAADADIKARQRIIGVQNRINLLEAKGVDISQARARLSQAIVAEEQRNFGTVRRVTSQLSNTLKVEEGRLRVSAAQAAQLKRQEAAVKGVASAERGSRQRPTGVGFATTPEQILAGRGGTQRGAAQSLNAREAAADKLVQLRNRINILDAQGVKLSSQKATLENILQAANAGQLGTSRQLVQSLSRQLSIEENNLRVTKLREAADKRRASEAAKAARAAQSNQAVPSAGEPAIPGFIPLPKVSKDQQKRAQAASKRRADILSNALIGGAFPLLFGQGAGASAGGLLGGAAGGLAGGQFGFGGSLVGTAVGAQIDAAIQKLQALGTALQDPVGSFTALQQAALLSSKGVEKNVEALIAAGRQEEASAAIRADLTASFGDVSGATALNKALDELQRTWSALGVAVVSFTAGPLSDFIEKLNQGLRAGLELSQDERLNIQRRAEAAVSDKANLLQQSGFFGAISVPFEGKTFTGSAAGVRQEIIAQLEKELLLQKQNAREEKARQQYTTETADVVARRGELLDTENALLVANANNDKSRTLELQKQKLILEQNLALGNLPANASDITRNEIRLDFAQKILAVETQIRNLPAAGSTGQLESSLQKANEALSRLRVNADSINFRSAVADVASLEVGLRAAQGATAGVKADILSAGIAAGDFANSFENVNSVLQNLEQFRGTLDIDSSAFVNATADILQTQDQLRQLDGQKATIEAELIVNGLENGSLVNSIGLQQQLSQAFRAAAESAPLFSEQFYSAVQNYQDANKGLEIAAGIMSGAFKDGQDAINQAAQKVQSVLIGNFDLLTKGYQGQLISKAQANIDFNVFDSRKIGRDPRKILQAYQGTQQLNAAQQDLGSTVNAVANLDKTSDKLAGVMTNLIKKDWTVNVSVNAATGASEVQLG